MADIVFRDNHKAVNDAMQRALKTALEAVAQAAEGYAKDEIDLLIYDTPPSPTYVRTGDLRKFIGHAVDMEKLQAIVGDNMDYAPYVEFGTVKMPARPFIRQSISKHIDEYRQMMSDILRDLTE